MNATRGSSNDDAAVTIRLMRAEDIPLGLALCRIAGWNQLAPDWETLLALAPEGVFVAEIDGTPCGTASTTPYGRETAWIGMVLMHPDFRRRGVGTALLVRCIEHLQAMRIDSIKLDATDLGRPVYLKLGFAEEREIFRLTGARPEAVGRDGRVRAIGEADWPALARLDRAAFGADRTALLRLLASRGPAALLAEGDTVKAFGFARPGHNAAFVGPIVAGEAESARALALALLAELPRGTVFWDLLPDNAAAFALAESLGFQTARRLMRMYLGERMNPGDVQAVFAAAGFELG